MQIEDYLAMGGVKARNALTDESDVEVLKGVYLRDPRAIVTAKAERRLHTLGVPLPKAEAAEPEPEAEAPAPVAEPEPFGEMLSRLAVTTYSPEPALEAVVATDVESEPTPEPEPAPESEPKLNVDAALPLPSTTRKIGSTRLDYLTLTGVTTWKCRGCGVEAPLETFGTRMVGGHRYMQPRCVKCRSGRKPKSPSTETSAAAVGSSAT